MEYKTYTNEEVKTWTDAPKRIKTSDLENSFKDGYGKLNCIIALQYIDDAFDPVLELQLREAVIYRAYKQYGDWFIEFRIKKNLNEMKNNGDIYSDVYIKPFQDVELFSMDSLDFKWRFIFTLAQHVLMQRSDNRIVILKDELQPQWIQEWHSTGGDYDFSKNNPHNPC